MIFFFLISFTYQFFLPYSATNKCFISIVTEREFNKLLKSSQYLILYVPASEYSLVTSEEFIFASLPTVFSEGVTFVAITSDSANRLYSKYSKEFSNIYIFSKGVPLTSFVFPNSEAELLGTISFLTQNKSVIHSTRESLFSALGDSAYTFISTNEKALEVQQKIIQLSPYYGTINSLFCTKELLIELRFSGNQICLYRKSDKQLLEVGTSEESLIKSFQPSYYTKLSTDQFVLINGEVVLLIVDEKPDHDIKVWFSTLANDYPNYIFAIFYQSQMKQLLSFFDSEPPFYPYILVASYSKGIFYDSSSIITSSSISYEDCQAYLSSIKAGKIKPSYPSEPIPLFSDQDDVISKIVGKSHNEFILDPKYDVIMFYYKGGFDSVQKLTKQLANYLVELNIRTIKIGYIDVEKNSAPGSFPIMMGDTNIHIYPSNNKEANNSMIGSHSLYTLIRFIKQNTKTNLVENEGLFNPSLEMSYLISYAMEYDNFYEKQRKLLDNYIQEMGYKLGLGTNTQEIIQNIHQKQGLKSPNLKDRGKNPHLNRIRRK